MNKNVFVVLTILAGSFHAVAQDPGWPRLLTSNGNKLIFYMPQVEEWPNYEQISFRMAFSLNPYQGKEVLGVVYIFLDNLYT